jgi:hypothetical protein
VPDGSSNLGREQRSGALVPSPAPESWRQQPGTQSMPGTSMPTGRGVLCLKATKERTSEWRAAHDIAMSAHGTKQTRSMR